MMDEIEGAERRGRGEKREGVEKREESHTIDLPAVEVEDTTEYPSGIRRCAIGFILGFSVVLPMLVYIAFNFIFSLIPFRA